MKNYKPRHMKPEPIPEVSEEMHAILSEKEKQEPNPETASPLGIPFPDPDGEGEYIPIPGDNRSSIAPNGAIVRNPWSQRPEVTPDNKYTDEQEDMNLLIM